MVQRQKDLVQTACVKIKSHETACVKTESHQTACVKTESHQTACVKTESHQTACVKTESHQTACVKTRSHQTACVKTESYQTACVKTESHQTACVKTRSHQTACVKSKSHCQGIWRVQNSFIYFPSYRHQTHWRHCKTFDPVPACEWFKAWTKQLTDMSSKTGIRDKTQWRLPPWNVWKFLAQSDQNIILKITLKFLLHTASFSWHRKERKLVDYAQSTMPLHTQLDFTRHRGNISVYFATQVFYNRGLSSNKPNISLYRLS